MRAEQGARRALERIFTTDPHNGHAWAVMGQMDQADGELDAALECFRRGTMDPGAAAPRSYLADDSGGRLYILHVRIQCYVQYRP